MKLPRTLRVVLATALLPIAFIHSPSACGGQPAGSVQSAPVPDPSNQQAPSAPERSFDPLPHPAFAMAAGTDAAAGGLSVADVAERVVASVVSVSSERIAQSAPMLPFGFGPFHGGRPRKQQGVGSGVIVSKEGIILTNNHVIEDATEIKVAVSGGREFEAELVGADDKSDLAVLRLKGDVKGLEPIVIGASGGLRLGDIVLAVGNPFHLGQTVTMGIVSATGRADVGIADYEDFIQTDAAINPGNSGGALVNMRGELVGINTAIFSRSGGNQGIGFAIPTDMARPIMDSLLAHGKVMRGFLGVGIQDLDPALAAAMNLGDVEGVLISSVRAGSAADKAGVKQGDVVTAVNGETADSAGRLRNLIGGAGAGTKVRLSILRAGKGLTLDVELGTLEDEGPSGKGGDPKPSSGSLGMKLEDVTPAIARRLELDPTLAKVVVSAVDPDSAAAEAGIRPGDVIVEVNRKAAQSARAVQTTIAQSKGTLLVLISRGGAQRYLAIARDDEKK